MTKAIRSELDETRRFEERQRLLKRLWKIECEADLERKSEEATAANEKQTNGGRNVRKIPPLVQQPSKDAYTATLEQNMTQNETPAEMAHRLLRDSSYYQLRFLTCTFDKGVLKIAGRLPSFHLKQVAQNAVIGIEGVVRVENNVEITG